MRWLRTFDPRPDTSAHLVCFPHGGASAVVYREWARDLPDLQVHGVQYPGRADRFNEPFVEDVRAAARRIAHDVAALGDGRVALFGHSVGAFMAFETARCLEADGRDVEVLFVSGARAPHDPRRRDTLYADVAEEDFLHHVKRLGGTDAELLVDRSMREVMLTILRSDYRTAENYRVRPDVRLDCPLVSVVGDEDPVTDPQQAWLWGELTRGTFATRVFRGGHFFPVERRTDVVRTVALHFRDSDGPVHSPTGGAGHEL